MSKSVSVYVNYNDELKKGKQDEVMEDNYERTDAVENHYYNTVKETSNAEWNPGTHNAALGEDITGKRCYRLTTVCLVLLCVILLAAITVISVKLAGERDQLQTSYNTLAVEKDQLQTKYTNVTVERDELQIRYNNLTTVNNQLKRDMDTLQKNLLQMGWGFYNSSIYYISTEKTTWSKSREECKMRGADLVIINSREEQEFISKQFNQTEAWIGLNDIVKEGEFKWVDGKELSINFWRSGEPNDFAGNEDCTITDYNNSTSIFSWNDFPCNHIGRAVAMCERVLN